MSTFAFILTTLCGLIATALGIALMIQIVHERDKHLSEEEAQQLRWGDWADGFLLTLVFMPVFFVIGTLCRLPDTVQAAVDKWRADASFRRTSGWFITMLAAAILLAWLDRWFS